MREKRLPKDGLDIEKVKVQQIEYTFFSKKKNPSK